jgi:UDP-4-amino-4-deoxy-L-arabinose formyltransferase/UDP-glucuronic acid dehydrogenase (UDP-4-keto-hexauronic acid decarboxylating)
VVYAGCTETGGAVLRSLLDAGVPITEVVTIDPARGDDHAVSGYEDLGECGADAGIERYYPERYDMDSERDRQHFRELSADVLVVNGWQRLVPEPILETFTHGGLGIHGSAAGLPAGRGRSPLNWSLIEGCDRFLLSLIRLAPGADDGAIARTRKFDLNTHDDIRTLYYKVAMVTTELLETCLGPIVRGAFEFTPQEGEPTYYPKRTPEDGAIHWGNTTEDVYDLVRAVARPYPGAFTEQDGHRIMIWAARPFSTDIAATAPAGRIVRVFEATGDFVVATADGTLLITDWEADGWTPESGTDLDSLGDHDRVDRPEHRHNLTGGGS